MKRNPESVTTVALSHAEIYELLEACDCVDWENPDYMSARAKLRAMVKDTKASNDSNPEGKTA